MMKNIRKKIVSILLTASMVAGFSIPFSVSATEANEMTVTVSMEGLTLGQGMYFEPETYTLSEINDLVAQENYGPYQEDELTAAMATLAFIIDHDIEYQNTGTIDSGFYLSQVKNIDKGTLDIPSVIFENGFSEDYLYETNEDEYLGEFDYSDMAGWMITVNDLMIPVGSSDFRFKEYDNSAEYPAYQNYDNDYVVRWQFTLWGYGGDLGFDTGWGMPAYFSHANKDLLYKAYAERSADGTFYSNPALKANVLSVMENLTATQEQVDSAVAMLEQVSVDEVLDDTLRKMAETVTQPSFGTNGGEWSVLSLARGNYFDTDSAYFNDYYDRIVNTVNETAASVNKGGALHSRKYTENSRLILALSAIGKDPHQVGDWDILAPLEDVDATVWQGINGPVFALLALDSQQYQTINPIIRQQYIDYILNHEITSGGWALSGSSADPDMTAMALQALSRYTSDEKVAAAVERGINVLSSVQKDNGGYASWGSVNAESIAQVIVACTALGIDPDKDERFVKNGNSAVDALLGFYDKDSADFTFRHVMDGKGNAMATDQAAYALVAYQRFLNQQNSLYDMTDVKLETVPVKFKGASLGLSGNIAVRFYMELDNAVLSDENAYMLFSLPDGSEKQVMVSDAQTEIIDGNACSVFTCEVNAKEMHDNITGRIYLHDMPYGQKCIYSVESYADVILHDSTGAYDEKTKNLVQAMMNYGDYTKAYFSNKTLSATEEMNAVTAETLARYAKKEAGTLPKGISYYGSSLLLESDTTIRHYFKVHQGTDVNTYHFNGNKNNYYYIDLENIPAGKLFNKMNCTIGGYTMQYSPMSYAYAVLNSSSANESLKNTVKALYLYGKAAEQYQN